MIILIGVMVMLVVLAAPRATRALTWTTATRHSVEPVAERGSHPAPSLPARGIAPCASRRPPTNTRLGAAHDLRWITPMGQCANAGLRTVLLILGNVLRKIQVMLKHHLDFGPSQRKSTSAFAGFRFVHCHRNPGFRFVHCHRNPEIPTETPCHRNPTEIRHRNPIMKTTLGV
jgi:hypothetical protein